MAYLACSERNLFERQRRLEAAPAAVPEGCARWLLPGGRAGGKVLCLSLSARWPLGSGSDTAGWLCRAATLALPATQATACGRATGEDAEAHEHRPLVCAGCTRHSRGWAGGQLVLGAVRLRAWAGRRAGCWQRGSPFRARARRGAGPHGGRAISMHGMCMCMCMCMCMLHVACACVPHVALPR